MDKFIVGQVEFGALTIKGKTYISKFKCQDYLLLLIKGEVVTKILLCDNKDIKDILNNLKRGRE